MSEALESLEPLFQKAESDGLWFYSNYQGIWFSPKELREYHKKGQFRWGAVNWQLRDPSEQFAELHARKRNVDVEIANLKARMSNQ